MALSVLTSCYIDTLCRFDALGLDAVLNMRNFSLGLGDQFEMVKEKYREANLLLGDIVKVKTFASF